MIERICIDKKYKMSENLHTPTEELPPPKIIFRLRTPEEEARTQGEVERKKRLIGDAYDRAVDAIVERIPEQLPDAEKLAVLYGIFLEEMTYDYDMRANVTEGGFVGAPEGMNEFVIGGEIIRGGSKEVAILKRTGVCEHFSEAFSDIAERLGIPSAAVSGKTKMVEAPDGSIVGLKHAWNQVLIDGEVKNIDVTYGLYTNDEAVKQEKGIAPEVTAASFFLIDSDELRRIGPHHDFEDSAELLAKAA